LRWQTLASSLNSESRTNHERHSWTHTVYCDGTVVAYNREAVEQPFDYTDEHPRMTGCSCSHFTAASTSQLEEWGLAGEAIA
jgi:hypothetical protein